MSDYMIITQPSSPHLELSVNKFYKEGWQPLGGPIFIPNPNSVVNRDGCWCQAMVKGQSGYSISSSPTITSFPDVIPISPPPVDSNEVEMD